MSKKFLTVLITGIAIMTLFQISSCSKDDDSPEPVCTIAGAYTGTFTNAGGGGVFTYVFKGNNYVEGSVKPTDPVVTYGGYRNTCDSLFISSRYIANGHYYIFEGKFSNNRNTITGTYKNLSVANETGPFILNKF